MAAKLHSIVQILREICIEQLLVIYTSATAVHDIVLASMSHSFVYVSY